jgi:hypothetical protein
MKSFLRTTNTIVSYNQKYWKEILWNFTKPYVAAGFSLFETAGLMTYTVL